MQHHVHVCAWVWIRTYVVCRVFSCVLRGRTRAHAQTRLAVAGSQAHNLQLKQVFPWRAETLRAAAAVTKARITSDIFTQMTNLQWTTPHIHTRARTKIMQKTLCSSLPHSHLAVHHVGKVKVRQQVGHVKVGLAILLNDAMVTGHKRQQHVTLQLREAPHLVFGELLQDVALVGRFKVTWDNLGFQQNINEPNRIPPAARLAPLWPASWTQLTFLLWLALKGHCTKVFSFHHGGLLWRNRVGGTVWVREPSCHHLLHPEVYRFSLSRLLSPSSIVKVWLEAPNVFWTGSPRLTQRSNRRGRGCFIPPHNSVRITHIGAIKSNTDRCLTGYVVG